MKLFFGIFLLGLFAGCARFHPQPLAAAKNAASLQSRSFTHASLRVFLETNLHHQITPWPARSWDFTMLTLAALYYHPSLDVARAQWAVAEAGKITAGERPNPTLYLLPGYDTTTTVLSPWLPLATFDIPIETAGKRRDRIGQATHLSEAARFNLASVAWQVRSGVRKSLLELNSARKQEALLKEQQRLQLENLRSLERQHEDGAIAGFEVTQAKIETDTTRLALYDSEQASAEARAQLAEAIGVPMDALDSLEFSFEDFDQPPAEPTLAEARRQALLHRADILGALAEYAASQSALQLEIATQYPDIHLGPGYQYNQGDNQWLLGLTITLPVFNHNQGGVAEAAARFNALQARVLSEIDRATAAYHVARRRKADAESLLAQLQKQEKTSQAIFEAGGISRNDLVGLRLQRNASAIARLDAVLKSQEALGQLEDALQSPLGLPPVAWERSPRVSQAGEARNHP